LDKRVDQITVEAARRGDREAAAKLLAELADPWFRLCLGLLRDRDDARDAVQETALRFVRDLHKFQSNSSIMTWSMGIAINVTREMRRKNRATESMENNEPIAAMPRIARSPNESAVLNESRDLLRASISDLPERQREALLLRFFEELSVEETAAAMSCASGTVKATIHQALRALKMKLKDLS
jgi:RNA polymerase sigma-70 factor (ECF subfamily)